jgi:hypothetical protein
MLASDTIPVNMAVFVFQQIQVHYVNAAIWNTRELIAKEVNNSLNQIISEQSKTIVFHCNWQEVFRKRLKSSLWRDE